MLDYVEILFSNRYEIASKIPNADVRQFNIIVDAFLELENKGVDELLMIRQ